MDKITLEIKNVQHHDPLLVACENLICRKRTPESFKELFPLSLGSTGIFHDLVKNYCFHFQTLDPPKESPVLIKKWLKEKPPERETLEVSQFISLLTGIPEIFFGLERYQDIIGVVRSGIDEKWENWSRKVLGEFSTDIFYEESLKITLRPRRGPNPPPDKKVKAFKFTFDVTLGELDRIFDDHDKLSLKFHFKLSKNYLRKLRSRWLYLINEVDLEGQKEFKKEVARYLELILKEKENWFLVKIWPSGFYLMMASELIDQAHHHEEDLFRTYEDEMLTMPVKFNYGLFALGFLKTRFEFTERRTRPKRN